MSLVTAFNTSPDSSLSHPAQQAEQQAAASAVRLYNANFAAQSAWNPSVQSLLLAYLVDAQPIHIVSKNIIPMATQTVQVAVIATVASRLVKGLWKVGR